VECGKGARAEVEEVEEVEVEAWDVMEEVQGFTAGGC